MFCQCFATILEHMGGCLPPFKLIHQTLPLAISQSHKHQPWLKNSKEKSSFSGAQESSWGWSFKSNYQKKTDGDHYNVILFVNVGQCLYVMVATSKYIVF